MKKGVFFSFEKSSLLSSMFFFHSLSSPLLKLHQDSHMFLKSTWFPFYPLFSTLFHSRSFAGQLELFPIILKQLLEEWTLGSIWLF